MIGRLAICVMRSQLVAHPGTPLRQHLKHMPIGVLHCIEYGIDEWDRNFLVKKIAHGIDEYHPASFPTERLIEPVWPKR